MIDAIDEIQDRVIRKHADGWYSGDLGPFETVTACEKARAMANALEKVADLRVDDDLYSP